MQILMGEVLRMSPRPDPDSQVKSPRTISRLSWSTFLETASVCEIRLALLLECDCRYGLWLQFQSQLAVLRFGGQDHGLEHVGHLRDIGHANAVGMPRKNVQVQRR